ncbi:uncharacterized protein MAM_07783 [Metarhizium album ARSEF 1941]|uniref:Uncharacterized protein n=1 Tax=Metarhizium album (strain ARSEF 1941) TaxID=1081103 RepID=A0A0B2WL07_METAS|nr:uncharacterized protein MAM_07783 [Metarhizium album ARSEF 1941]KHN94354.1 hypothetical protein MAM_07783 [Metarhizium album ARSEF 1941]
MKFVTVVVVTLAGIASAAPYKRSIVNEDSVVVGRDTSDADVADIENVLQSLSGRALPQSKRIIGGIPLIAKLLSLMGRGLAPGIIKAVVAAIGMIGSGLGIDAANDYLGQATNGSVPNLGDFLGANNMGDLLSGIPGLGGLTGSS